uniref:Type II secretion system protein C n=1 Tax=Candidatus Kentrum sp. FW TaxID=2126338 RepID=A0A450TP73_9GAMM|nr:MAG: type II secretion system protein C [Candidatus Kentron sp. FW]
MGFWITKHPHRILPLLVSLLLLVGIGYTIFHKFHTATTADTSTPDSIAAQSQKANYPSAKETIDPSQKIAEMHLFGPPPEETPTPAPAIPIVTVAETTLNLVLHGIISSGEEGGSLAIIASENGQQDTYSEGAKLPGGATITEVNNDYVVLLNDNRLETLCMWEVPQDASAADEAEKFLPVRVNSKSTKKSRRRIKRRRPRQR